MRKLRYRLRRQGMAELDAWLSPLEEALSSGDVDVNGAIERLLECEPPVLLAMMHGEAALPASLRPWLERRA